ncbi:MAG: 4Fe-4S binding protein [Chlamydiae bacterium]|nr:4Fe-4S binding protein [Chlamydiota bacterium]
MKKTQKFTIWLLPLVVLGGLFYPILGYLVIGMMVFLLILSLFKGRYWCWYLCPRGSFLDILLSKISKNKSVPAIFSNKRFRWTIFSLFMAFVVFRVVQTGGNLIAIGWVFVSMCILTTIISIVLGVATKHRCWCMICPMGTLQDKLSKMTNLKKKQ